MAGPHHATGFDILPVELTRYLDEHGVLTAYPAKQHRKKLVLIYLASKFEPEQLYTEREVNELLKQWHTFEDWALLRRDLVDFGHLRRTDLGESYQLTEPQPG